jgi:hypothetical protein
MTIEVRQMLIKSVVEEDDRPASGPADARTAADADQARRQLVAECKTWLMEKLQSRNER